MDIISVVDDEEHLKIISFLSFQTDHKIVNGIMLHKIRPHPTKHPSNQDSATSTILFGQHHEKPHLPIKCCARVGGNVNQCDRAINQPHKEIENQTKELRGSVNSPTSTRKKLDSPLGSLCMVCRSFSWVTHCIIYIMLSFLSPNKPYLSQ